MHNLINRLAATSRWRCRWRFGVAEQKAAEETQHYR